MILSTYLMKYEVYDEAGKLLKQGKIRAKKKESEFAAKAGFGSNIEKKYGANCKLIILSCTRDFGLGDFGDIFNPNKNKPNFGDIFGNMGDIFNPKS